MDALRMESDRLATLEKRQQGGGVLFLIAMLENLASAFNIAKNMNAEQLTETAIGIVEEYPNFSINDIAVCFQKAKKGAYGEIYDRLDTATVFKFLNQYYEAKLIALEKYNREKAKPTEPPTEDTPEQKQRFAKNIAKIKTTLAAKQSPPKPAATVGNTTDHYQQWMRQFDQHYRRAGKSIAGIKFIKRYGHWLDVAKYLEYKATQFQRFSS